MSMSLDDAIFWIAITIFGAGLYLVPEHKALGIVLMLVGAAGTVYSIRAHLRSLARPAGLMALMMILTWAAVGYDIYDRDYGLDRSDSVTVNIPEQVTHHTPLLPLSTQQTKRLNLIRALAANWNEYPYKEVFDRSFNDESVLLDDRNFIHCRFTNVKLIYEGTEPFRIEEGKFVNSGPAILGSDNPIVLGVMNALSYQGGGQSRNVPSLP